MRGEMAASFVLIAWLAFRRPALYLRRRSPLLAGMRLVRYAAVGHEASAALGKAALGDWPPVGLERICSRVRRLIMRMHGSLIHAPGRCRG